uniref:Transposable element P transposase-like RNase H domain-containing protein n=1 Tax=Ixodes scapularis TaxID=6945 RepID=A0A1S4KV54_IXOSC
MLCGLSVGFKIPVGYLFTQACSSGQLARVVLHIIRKVEELGLEVVRLVSDSRKVNVSAMGILCSGAGSYCIPHLVNTQRKLFVAFDQSHIIKNVRSQFLATQ